ncbi:MAG: gamma carbonic anhydrase family protein [Gammaproteobacteria bacterium]|jgi:carbonic anhydrase/acetyltransferase-like protein (isoleucine patch superfamily)
MTIRTYQNITPALGDRVFVDDSALVAGDVTIGDDSSIWPMTVVRGDVNRIAIGNCTNIQDGSVLHVTHPHDQHPDGFALHVGNRVTVGHKVILHGCVIEDDCLIGMGSVIMDGAVVQSQVLVGAGSLVSPGKTLESGYLYLGSPVKRVRPLTSEESAWIDYSATHYVNLKNRHTG